MDTEELWGWVRQVFFLSRNEMGFEERGDVYLMLATGLTGQCSKPRRDASHERSPSGFCCGQYCRPMTVPWRQS